jgi:hypothetical protein
MSGQRENSNDLWHRKRPEKSRENNYYLNQENRNTLEVPSLYERRKKEVIPYYTPVERIAMNLPLSEGQKKK